MAKNRKTHQNCTFIIKTFDLIYKAAYLFCILLILEGKKKKSWFSPTFFFTLSNCNFFLTFPETELQITFLSFDDSTFWPWKLCSYEKQPFFLRPLTFNFKAFLFFTLYFQIKTFAIDMIWQTYPDVLWSESSFISYIAVNWQVSGWKKHVRLKKHYQDVPLFLSLSFSSDL